MTEAAEQFMSSISGYINVRRFTSRDALYHTALAGDEIFGA
jgi:hypothetical protein